MKSGCISDSATYLLWDVQGKSLWWDDNLSWDLNGKNQPVLQRSGGNSYKIRGKRQCKGESELRVLKE